MVKPIKSLELHYPMIQFLIIHVNKYSIFKFRSLSLFRILTISCGRFEGYRSPEHNNGVTTYKTTKGNHKCKTGKKNENSLLFC